MITTSQLCMLLLNIYFNVLVLSPLWQSYKAVRYNQVISSMGFDLTPESVRLEGEIDAIMHEYVVHLKQINKIQDQALALTAIQQAKAQLSKRIQKITPELQLWKKSLSKQEAKTFTDKLLVKPYFKQINDLTFAFNLSRKGENNAELLKAYQSLNELMPVLFN
jgi:MoxR-like ATPase